MELDSIFEPSPIQSPDVREASADLDRDDFLRMLIAQLENQDPLDPQDAAEFTAQLATFSSVEQLLAIRTGIDQLVTNDSTGEDTSDSATVDQILAAANLIGRDVLVEGQQFEVPNEGNGPDFVFDLATRASNVEIDIRGEGNNIVRTIQLGALAQDAMSCRGMCGKAKMRRATT